MKTLSLSLAFVSALALAPNPALAQEIASSDTATAYVEIVSPRDQALTPDQVREELGLARKALEQIHPGYTRYTSAQALDALWADASAKALATPTRGAIYLQVSRVLAAIRCDHTKAEIPADFEKARESEPLYLPFRYAIFDDRLYVKDAGDADLIAGTEILAIDGVPAQEVIAKIFDLFPVDGDTDFIKGESVVAQGEFVGPAFDHFYPFLYETKADVTLSLSGGREATVQRHTYTQHFEATGEERFSRNFDEAVTFKLLSEKAAYLSVDTFINYRRPVDPDTIYGPIFAQMARSGRDTLILDLRRNGGGSDDAQAGLVQWLMPDAYRQADAIVTKTDTIDPELKPYLSTWVSAALNPDPAWFKQREDGMFEIINPLAGKAKESIPAKRGAFTGKLIVLTSTDNASGVTHLLSVMRTQRPDTVFIGEKTGGAATGATAGILYTLTLPHSGVKVRVPLQRQEITNSDQLDPRGGITPDIAAPDTLLSTLAGTDPAMEAAVEYVTNGE